MLLESNLRIFHMFRRKSTHSFSSPGEIPIFVNLEVSIILVEKQTLAVRSSEVSVKPRSYGNYLEFLGNAGQFNCQFLDLDKLKRPQGAHPSPRPQGLANSGSDDF